MGGSVGASVAPPQAAKTSVAAAIKASIFQINLRLCIALASFSFSVRPEK
jgi:hypothetical protein